MALGGGKATIINYLCRSRKQVIYCEAGISITMSEDVECLKIDKTSC